MIPGSLTKRVLLPHLRCPKLAWWLSHEPTAPETRETVSDRVRMAQGTEVGILARDYVPGGRLVDRGDHRSLEEVLAETDRLMRDGTRVIYEGAFLVHDALVFVDILQRHGDSWTLIEVKSSTSVTDDHIADAAFQTHVLRSAGIPIHAIEIMHLNRDCRHPDLSNLFVREEVTEQVLAMLPRMATEITAFRQTVAGSLPTVEIGDHCSTPGDCPFKPRCWPPLPDHHVSTLYRIQKKKVKEYVDAGYHTIHDLPESLKLSAIAARQRRAVREGRIVIEHDALANALRQLTPPVAHLDFETIQLAIPRWPGCRPFDQIPVQVSCHVVGADGTEEHHAWIADSPEDPRRAVAEEVLAACRGARTVTAYYAVFEQGRLRELAEAYPDLAAELNALADAVIDLLPVVRDHVYHPDFGGSFSLKKVLPALVPSLTYEDLVIREGETASAELLRLMFGSAQDDADTRTQLRDALHAYCERDTKAMVALAERLAELSLLR